MTSHKLAKLLLAGPDLPCVINGWGSDEGLGHRVVDIVDKPRMLPDVVLPGESYTGRPGGRSRKVLCIGLDYSSK